VPGQQSEDAYSGWTTSKTQLCRKVGRRSVISFEWKPRSNQWNKTISWQIRVTPGQSNPTTQTNSVLNYCTSKICPLSVMAIFWFSSLWN
jgi:hypothetical protein